MKATHYYVNSIATGYFNSLSDIVYSPIIIKDIVYTLTQNKTQVNPEDSITFTLTANAGTVANGTVFNYVMFGNITINDFSDLNTIGTMIMYNNIAIKTIQISPNSSSSLDRLISFSVLEAKVGTYFTILASLTPTINIATTIPSFKQPIIGTPEVCEDGRIMFIPITDSGDKYIVPPLVRVSGAGFGFSGTANLDTNGHLESITINQPGSGFVPSRYNNNCVIDNFVVNNPGIGYYAEPTVYVNGRSGVATATINSIGQLIGIQVINKTQVYNCTPTVEIYGGNGIGGSATPIMVCRNDENHQQFIETVAPYGTDSVIDCP
jgi:hypothetical protein